MEEGRQANDETAKSQAHIPVVSEKNTGGAS